MLGAFAVGKTSLVARFVKSIYSDQYHPTVGVKVDKKIVLIGTWRSTHWRLPGGGFNNALVRAGTVKAWNCIYNACSANFE
jgi:GTPase SAR1 family protein